MGLILPRLPANGDAGFFGAICGLAAEADEGISNEFLRSLGAFRTTLMINRTTSQIPSSQ
jgi:hypothetical protein